MIRAAFLAAGLTLLTLAASQVAADPPPPTVLVFGDSLTEGYGLPPEQGLVPQLQDWLAAHDTPARLINAGLSGDTTYGGRVRIGWAMRHDPDAVIVQLGANDMLMGIGADQAARNLSSILKTAGASGAPVLLVGIADPDGRTPDGWPEIWPRLAQRSDALLLDDLYAPLAAIDRPARAAYLQADGLHPSAQGVTVIAEHLGPAVQDLIAQIAPTTDAAADRPAAAPDHSRQ